MTCLEELAMKRGVLGYLSAAALRGEHGEVQVETDAACSHFSDGSCTQQAAAGVTPQPRSRHTNTCQPGSKVQAACSEQSPSQKPSGSLNPPGALKKAGAASPWSVQRPDRRFQTKTEEPLIALSAEPTAKHRPHPPTPTHHLQLRGDTRAARPSTPVYES
ncbi:unnamed protein product [Pleuronectes platessa]|uniref:Uncharacterized protein n=1 Tax=Pleuronectes platessa TaxID=8262 RepID=A0A9N7Z439_PLEPL|nr:unnamed protein product [Pleuronectes platessa]